MDGLVSFFRARLDEDERAAAWDDRARGMAEVSAKRHILARHKPRGIPGGPPYRWACTWCGVVWPCPDLRDMASVYAERSGYRREWAPHVRVSGGALGPTWGQNRPSEAVDTPVAGRPPRTPQGVGRAGT